MVEPFLPENLKYSLPLSPVSNPRYESASASPVFLKWILAQSVFLDHCKTESVDIVILPVIVPPARGRNLPLDHVVVANCCQASQAVPVPNLTHKLELSVNPNCADLPPAQSVVLPYFLTVNNPT